MILRIAFLMMIAHALFGSELSIGLAQEVQGDRVNPVSGKPSKEHLTMEGVEIQGTLEQPHAVYVIPWGDIQDTVGENKPLNRSFREEILKPVDREQFYRRYQKIPTSVKGGAK